MKSLFTVLVATLLLSGSLLAQDYVERNLTLDASSIDYMKVDVGSGELHVTGVEGTDEITVHAKISGKNMDEEDLNKYIEKKLTFTLKQRGNNALLKVENTSNWRWFGSGYVSVDLEVKVPKQMDMDIDDGSGPTLVENIRGDVEIDDGSGELTVRNISGKLRIDDGSGRLTIEDIAGTVEVDDGSGSLSINNVDGSVVIEDDGSGSITIDTVSKDVYVGDAGSGSVTIRNVSGTITRDD